LRAGEEIDPGVDEGHDEVKARPVFQSLTPMSGAVPKLCGGRYSAKGLTHRQPLITIVVSLR